MFARAICFVTILATTAHASPQQDAQALAARGDYVAAAAKFRDAFAAERRPELMCNVGVAYHKGGDLPRAQRYLRRCLDLGTDLERAYMDTVATVLATIEGELAAGGFSLVTVHVQPDTATIAVSGDVPFDEPLANGDRVWFPAGDYTVTVSAEGFATREAPLHAAKSGEVRFELAPIATAARAGTPQRSSMRLPLIASGATLVAGVGALVFHLQMRDRTARAADATDLGERQRLRDEASSALHRTWIVGGLACAGAAVSGYLWYRWRRTNHALAVDVQGRDGATVSFGGAW